MELDGTSADLTFAKTCLDLINTTSDDVQKALWRAAIIYYSSASRAQKKEVGGLLMPGIFRLGCRETYTDFLHRLETRIWSTMRMAGSRRGQGS